MRKNGQYVGVDDKYIPEDEKYVEDDEVKETINDGVKHAKKYVNDNKDKFKDVGRKGLKIAKGVGIAYIAFFGFTILMFLLIFIMFIIMFFKTIF